MSNEGMLRACAIVGMVAAGLWVIALVVEYQYGLDPSGHNTGSSLYRLDQTAFFLAQVGYLVLLTGLFRSKAGGDGAFGMIGVGIWWLAVAALVVAQLLGLFNVTAATVLLPIGGLGQVLGSILTAVAVFRARRWTSWPRIAPAIWAAYTAVLIFSVIASVPFVSMADASGSGASPSEWAELGWQVAWFLVGLALFTEAGRRLEQREMSSRSSTRGF